MLCVAIISNHFKCAVRPFRALNRKFVRMKELIVSRDFYEITNSFESNFLKALPLDPITSS